MDRSTLSQKVPLSSPLYSLLLALVQQAESTSALEKGFTDVAIRLLLETTLELAGKAYQIMDIEFYFFNAEFHPDPYSHASQYAKSVQSKQSITGSWYFHRFTGMKTYTHTRRGLDLTYGDGDKQRYGGILIRAIKSLQDGRLITGPSRVMAELISALDNPEELERIAFDMQAGLAFDPTSLIYLKPLVLARKIPLYKSTRVGISDKNPKYQQKQYRFFTDLCQFKKGKFTPYSQITL